MKLPISLVVIAKNEEKSLPQCLASCSWVQDIVVVDSDSSDRTVEVAQKLGARVIVKPWMGFGLQKRFAVEQAKFDWVICLDADEQVSESLQAEILARFEKLDPSTGYYLPRKSYHMGRWITHGGWYPDYQLRLFNRTAGNWNDAPIHEKVIVSKSDRLSEPLYHLLFENLADQINTNNRYSSLQAEQHFSKGQKFNLYKLVIKPWVKFIECYFLKLGFLDGLPGFVIAVGAGYSVFIRWAKVWELERKKNA
jgi:glycosyltransferase involved in cell wall biosynthesis